MTTPHMIYSQKSPPHLTVMRAAAKGPRSLQNLFPLLSDREAALCCAKLRSKISPLEHALIMPVNVGRGDLMSMSMDYDLDVVQDGSRRGNYSKNNTQSQSYSTSRRGNNDQILNQKKQKKNIDGTEIVACSWIPMSNSANHINGPGNSLMQNSSQNNSTSMSTMSNLNNNTNAILKNPLAGLRFRSSNGPTEGTDNNSNLPLHFLSLYGRPRVDYIEPYFVVAAEETRRQKARWNIALHIFCMFRSIGLRRFAGEVRKAKIFGLTAVKVQGNTSTNGHQQTYGIAFGRNIDEDPFDWEVRRIKELKSAAEKLWGGSSSGGGVILRLANQKAWNKREAFERLCFQANKQSGFMLREILKNKKNSEVTVQDLGGEPGDVTEKSNTTEVAANVNNMTLDNQSSNVPVSDAPNSNSNINNDDNSLLSQTQQSQFESEMQTQQEIEDGDGNLIEEDNDYDGGDDQNLEYYDEDGNLIEDYDGDDDIGNDNDDEQEAVDG